MLSLITDRTLSNVDEFNTVKAKIYAQGWSALSTSEKAVWMSTKGEYRHMDLNRVGEAVQYLADLLNNYGYAVAVSPKTDWTVNDKPAPVQRTAYLANVITIKTRFYGTTELPAALDNMTFTDANNIELLLLEVESYIESMAVSFQYSDTFYAGEGS